MARHREGSSGHARRPFISKTMLTAILALFPLLNLVLLAVLETVKDYELHLPDSMFIGLNAALVLLTAIIALLNRILTVPGLVEWMEKYGLISQEKNTGSGQSK